MTNLDGNKFVNGIILGVALLTSGIFTGFISYLTNPKNAFEINAALAIAFSAINQFVLPGGTPLSYITLFVSILGIGGVLNCIYALIPSVMPREQVGGLMVLIVTFGMLTSVVAPMIALYEKPIPFECLVGLLTVSILML